LSQFSARVYPYADLVEMIQQVRRVVIHAIGSGAFKLVLSVPT
jgi:hypothetical protein